MRMLFVPVDPWQRHIYDRPVGDAGAAGGLACPD